MHAHLRIVSYFSRPTDLAGGMRSWPEFVDWSGYEAELRHTDEKEEQTVIVESHVDADVPHLLILCSSPGALFERVVGKVVSSLSADSDYLMVYRQEKPAHPGARPNAAQPPPRAGSSSQA